MNEWKHKTPPPLGEVRDLRQEEREALLGLEYEPLEKHPDLLVSVQIATRRLNSMRDALELAPVVVQPRDVRLIDSAIYEATPQAAGMHKEGKGFFHSELGICFLSFEVDARRSKTDQVLDIYSILHELAHKAMQGGVGQYSFALDEGFADWTTRTIMEEEILPHFKLQDTRVEYIRTMPPMELADGLPVEPRDMIFEESGEVPFQYPRALEVRLIEKLERILPGHVFRDLQRFVFQGDLKGTERVLTGALGSSIAKQLEGKEISLVDVLKKL